MNETHPHLHKSDWVRFQLKNKKHVLEGFIQEIHPDGKWIKIGKTQDSAESLWYSESSIVILDQQPAEAHA
jgi:hypothetical protein